MNKRQAKTEALGFVAAQLNAELGTGSWADQGLLDGYSERDQERILEAAHELLMEFYRRIDRAQGSGDHERAE